MLPGVTMTLKMSEVAKRHVYVIGTGLLLVSTNMNGMRNEREELMEVLDL